jgi:hypothetical protein
MSDDSLAVTQQSLGDSDITYPLWPPLTRGCPETSTDDVQFETNSWWLSGTTAAIRRITIAIDSYDRPPLQ